MNYFQLIIALLPYLEEIFKAVADAKAAGTPPAATHQTIADHFALLPAKIRA
jgi:hypothetical protein